MRLGIVIPCFNAALTLPGVLRRLAPVVDPAARIWIVDDGSRDHTPAVARAAAAAEKRITTIRRPTNGGYGAAVKTGLRAARAAGAFPVACLHADGQYAPELLPTLLRVMQQRSLDLLQGSRIASGTALSGGMPLYKYIAGRMLTALENRAFGLRMTDYHSGYLIYGRRLLQEIPFDRLSDGFEFDLEVIASARAHALTIGEHPIPTHYGEEISHLEPLSYGLRVLGVIVGYLSGQYDASRSTRPTESM